MRLKSQYKDLDYMKFIEIFNNEGKDEAKRYIKDSSPVSYPYFVRLLKENSGYQYNRILRKYEPVQPSSEPFMSIDDLLTKPKNDATTVVASIPQKIYYKDPIDEMNLDIFQDRLIEISKYIRLSQSNKTIEINMNRLRDSGYDITIKD